MRDLAVALAISPLLLAFVACEPETNPAPTAPTAPTATAAQTPYGYAPPGYPPPGYAPQQGAPPAGYQPQPAGYPAGYPTAQPAPAPYPAPAPAPQAYPTAPAPAPAPAAPTGSSGMATPGPLALPCQSDMVCGLHHCNTQYQKCAFPCQTAADCVSPNQCVIGVCVPTPPGAH